jgi:general secretion pathway protein A
LLVIDEAHQLNFEVLEEIRLLANFETSSHKLLQIVLCGQPELHDLLNRPELRQLKQRIAIRLRVRPLTPDEVAEYIRHRWHQAGATGAPPFAEAAIQLIARQSRGIPRLINSICDNALLLAFSETSATVSDELIARVSRDLDLDGAAPISCPSPALAEPELTAPNFASLRTLQRDMRREEHHFLGIRWATRAKRAVAGIGR